MKDRMRPARAPAWITLEDLASRHADEVMSLGCTNNAGRKDGRDGAIRLAEALRAARPSPEPSPQGEGAHNIASGAGVLWRGRSSAHFSGRNISSGIGTSKLRWYFRTCSVLKFEVLRRTRVGYQ